MPSPVLVIIVTVLVVKPLSTHSVTAFTNKAIHKRHRIRKMFGHLLLGTF